MNINVLRSIRSMCCTSVARRGVEFCRGEGRNKNSVLSICDRTQASSGILEQGVTPEELHWNVVIFQYVRAQMVGPPLPVPWGSPARAEVRSGALRRTKRGYNSPAHRGKLRRNACSMLRHRMRALTYKNPAFRKLPTLGHSSGIRLCRSGRRRACPLDAWLAR
jgi:hypothetical protein